MKASPELQALVEEALLREGWEFGSQYPSQQHVTHGGIGMSVMSFGIAASVYFLDIDTPIVRLEQTPALAERITAIIGNLAAKKDATEADHIAVATERLREYLTAKKPA